MKKKGILGAIVIALLCTGCVHKLNVVTTKAENNCNRQIMREYETFSVK